MRIEEAIGKQIARFTYPALLIAAPGDWPSRLIGAVFNGTSLPGYSVDVYPPTSGSR